MLSNIKRRKSQKALGVLTKGPGGGAMEGPPLIDRDHHSVHAGMQYFMYAHIPSVGLHSNSIANMHEAKTGLLSYMINLVCMACFAYFDLFLD